MDASDQFLASPAAAGLVMIPLEERPDYIERFTTLPDKVLEMLNSGNTAAFILGLVKDFQLGEELASAIAFLVLQVAVGKLEVAKLGSTLSSELQLANDKAQRLAQEIEKELLAPVMREWNEWLAKQNQAPAGAAAAQAGAQNVVDLKNQGKK